MADWFAQPVFKPLQASQVMCKRGWIFGIVNPLQPWRVLRDIEELRKEVMAGRRPERIRERIIRKAHVWETLKAGDTTYLEFLNLNQGSDSALGFVKRYGILREGDLVLGRRGVPSIIRRVWAEIKRHKSQPFAISLENFWFERDRLLALNKLWEGHRTKNSKAVTEAVSFMVQHLMAQGLMSRKKDYIVGVKVEWTLRGEITDQLQSVELIVRPGLQPVLFCKYVLPSLYLQFLMAIASRRPFRECANENCARGRYFIATRNKKRFCSLECKWAKRQRNRRAKKKKTRRKS